MAVTTEDQKAQRDSLTNLRVWLVSQGFKASDNHLASRENECRWYAWRRSSIPARRCECNDDREGVQIVVTPHLFTMRDRQYVSVDVDVTGQFGGPWFKLQAYSLGVDELPEKLPGIEDALVRAWNALSADGVPGRKP